MRIYKIRSLKNGRFARKSGNSFTKNGDSWTSKKRCFNAFKKMCARAHLRDYIEIVSFEIVEMDSIMLPDLFEVKEVTKKRLNGSEYQVTEVLPKKEEYKKQLKEF